MEKSRTSFSEPNLGRVREIVFSTWELDMKLQGIGLQPPQLCWGSKRHMVSAAWRHPKTSRCTEKREEVEHFWFFERNENNHTTWKIFVGRSFVFDVGVLFPFFFFIFGGSKTVPHQPDSSSSLYPPRCFDFGCWFWSDGFAKCMTSESAWFLASRKESKK